jgi:hypothetical protein
MELISRSYVVCQTDFAGFTKRVLAALSEGFIYAGSLLLPGHFAWLKVPKYR